MNLEVACPACSAEFVVESSIAPWGTEETCPSCGEMFTVPAQPLSPGLEFGGFKILKLIGEGGMGQVFLALQISMNREVALKVMRPKMTLDETPRKRFLNEVKLVAMLNHPNIVTAFEAGEFERVYYMAMEYVPGQTLADRIKEHGAMSEAEALPLLVKIAQALEYAWVKHHLLHRDIKPSNIMMDERDEPKLLDLGLSKIIQHPGDYSTVSMMVVGSPHYMSPEQAHAAAGIDTRADMYGLGATAFHLITGHLPFEGNDAIPSLLKRIQEEVPNPRVWNSKVSKPCCELLRRLLAKQPDDRYDDWPSLIEDMNRVAKGLHPVVDDTAPAPKKFRNSLIGGLCILAGILAFAAVKSGIIGGPPNRVSPTAQGLPAQEKEMTPEWARRHIQQAWPGQEGNLREQEDGWHFEFTGSHATSTTDLKPLQGMPLTSLSLRNSQVTNLEPLRGMNLSSLDLRGTSMTSLEALADMKQLVQCDGGFMAWNRTLQDLLRDDDLHPARDFAQRMNSVPVFSNLAEKVVAWLNQMEQFAADPERAKTQALASGSHRFLLWLAPKTWDDAKAFAEANGGQLASMARLEEAEPISQAFRLDGGFIWMGAYRDDGSWFWSDGSDWTYSNWGQDGEQSNAAGTFGARGLWKAFDRSTPHAFLIQWSKPSP